MLRYARRLRDEVQAINGVLEANLTGGRDELFEIIIDPVALGSYGLDAVEVLQIFNRSNRLIAAGKLDNGTGSLIKVPGLFKLPTISLTSRSRSMATRWSACAIWRWPVGF